ncbi:FAD-dependent oxidoreductase [Paenibacillus sp. TRM 82003]|uniref:FAD-dependent oxidoreductase n=1 Tax=Kineococcus sp. TRM81007 TaxID=2925831 RepID=UPI001F5AC5CF|nr:FAD-dependent oxidoreductase [Kineococcus sp. TRM81007]MCI2237622.1 FAD-dependent oxidoreductase [Kineococcus sp. TRM81007]MCI3921640.1 FAD-dependent oxidoreductase [Paenibacillus sp. TRM 82003]
MSAPTLTRPQARAGTDLPIVVAGGGSRGLAAAEALLDAGRSVVVVEAADAVGGLARSVELWGLPHSLAAPGVPGSAAAGVPAQWLDLAGGHVERTAAHRATVRGGRPTGPARPAGRLARSAARLAGAPALAGRHDVLSPVAGTGALWAELARRLRARGAVLLLGATAVGLQVQDGRVRGLCVRDAAGEHVVAARAVVDALPAHRRLLAPGAVAVARSLDTHLVHLLVDAPDGAPVGPPAHEVTVEDPSLRTRRLTAARAWRPRALAGPAGAVLRAELRTAAGDEVATLDDAALRDLVVAELPALGVTRPVRVLEHAVVHLPASAPVPGAALTEVPGALPVGLVRAEDGPVPGAGDGLPAGRAAAALLPLPVR